MSGGRPKSDEKQRFLEKVKIMETGCHEWQSTLDKGGYGKFYRNGKQAKAHRVAYDLFVAPISANRHLLHSCDNRKCVNVEHLSFGSSRDNIADMDAKGRRGTKSTLTYSKVEEIRCLLLERYSQKEIANRFGVHQSAISRIKLNKTRLFKERD
jgi:predicted XRE-type DNA-binding protein